MLCSVPSIPIILCCQEYSSLLPSVPMEISRPSILRIQHSHTVQTESHPVGWGITQQLQVGHSDQHLQAGVSAHQL